MLRLLATLAASALVALAAPAFSHAAPDRFEIGVQDPLEFPEQDPAGAYDAIQAGGMDFVRLPVTWSTIAAREPASARDPGDPAYQWEVIDSRLDRIRAIGLTPVLEIYGVPSWARPGGRRTPSAKNFAAFTAAVARRYSGKKGQRPRVRYFQLWNEPNLKMFLDDSAAHYRGMLNAGYKEVHGVHADNVVIAAGLAPFSDPKDEFGIAPMPYMRSLLRSKVSFDIWAQHPYTSGGPNHSAPDPDEASMGDLPQVNRILRAADRAGRIRSRGRTGFWVTEFGWDTSPPDPGGVPLARHARWAAEAMYRMWQSDVSVMMWFKLRDDIALNDNFAGTFQSGIFPNTTPLYADEREKPVGDVLRFPFVAVPEGARVSVWGRTPGGRGGAVTIQQRRGSKWVRVAGVRANRHGLFRLALRGHRGALLRARRGGATSPPFKATHTPDVRVNAFGGPPPS